MVWPPLTNGSPFAFPSTSPPSATSSPSAAPLDGSSHLPFLLPEPLA
eukprot:CAMPEP_0205942100 /NCGR_PEP_ID=MMETSP1325-20131115/56597_1 /ASSEMBLY_ACC=CAM_ASM_000708 /TAXON_ID=236786 /ORGANISM="Florenciella sp., Strain RCC1007" /LENGTH=46 /DNA_ID= /DNA_START= /DNA_END= /DNA_ORIENTATION=